MKNNNFELNLDITVRSSGDLLAPVKGTLNRMIKESINSELHYSLKNIKTGKVYSGFSPRSGLEIIDGIFDYF